MRVHNKGSTYAVTVTAREVDVWNRKWPCSSMTGRQYFEFSKRAGDLIGHVGKGDGAESVALSHDAQAYGRRALKLTS